MKRFIVAFFLICLTIFSFAQGNISIIHGPYLQNLKETEVTIVWESTKPSVGWVELAPDEKVNFYSQEHSKYFDTESGVKNVKKLHAVKITGLKPGTHYRYRVFAKEVTDWQGNRVFYGRTVGTDVFLKVPLSFVTNDRNKICYLFAMINDIHGRTADIPVLMNVADYKKMDFVLFNGDMRSIVTDEKSTFEAFMDTAIYIFAKEKPVYYVRGNHETRGAFAPHLHDYFSPKEPHLYYTFRQGAIYFIVLDTGEDKPDSDIEYYGITDFDKYRTEEAQWLSEILQSDECKSAPWKVVVCHMPPDSGNGAWHGDIEVMNKFIPLLNKAGVDLMLCGHVHKYIYEDPSSQVNFPVIVNSFDTVLKGMVDGNKINIEILDKTGKTVDKKLYQK